MRKKVTVVGGGFVGATTAQRILDRELADVVLTRHSRRRAGRKSAGHARIHSDYEIGCARDGHLHKKRRLSRNRE